MNKKLSIIIRILEAIQALRLPKEDLKEELLGGNVKLISDVGGLDENRNPVQYVMIQYKTGSYNTDVKMDEIKESFNKYPFEDISDIIWNDIIKELILYV